MADSVTPAKRSDVMSKVRSSGNKSTELRMIKLMRDAHITGWRRNSLLAGKPDFIFPQRRLAVFVDGCFWHGCPRCYRRPSSHQKYWDAKVAGNKKRYRRVAHKLRSQGWHVLRIWEHELRDTPRLTSRLHRALQPP